LFEEARRRRRRRWITGAVVTAVVAGGVVGVLVGGHPSSATRSSAPSKALPPASQALAWARRGLQASFVATYQLTADAEVTESAAELPTTIIVAQRGPLANVDGQDWIEPGPGQWSYLLEWRNGMEREMVKRPEGLYSCVRYAGAPWTCQGPDRNGGGNGLLTLVAAYEPVTQYYSLQQTLVGPPPDSDVTTTSTVIGGRPVHCTSAGPSETWCFTRQGTLVSFPTDPGPGPVGEMSGTLVASDGTVPAQQFSLPSRPDPWTGGLN
jgi:hypothetical protein